MDYSAILDAIEEARDNSLPRCRLFRRKWHMRPPEWLRQDPETQELFGVQDRLLAKGRLAWGVIVQANNILFSAVGEAGHRNAPADALYSLDPSSRDDPRAMFAVARQLFEFKAGDATDDESRGLGAILADEFLRKRGVRIPRALSPAYPTMMTSIFVERRHLPQHRLTGGLLPLLVLPETTDMIMIAPCRLWPQALIDEWRA